MRRWFRLAPTVQWGLAAGIAYLLVVSGGYLHRWPGLALGEPAADGADLALVVAESGSVDRALESFPRNLQSALKDAGAGTVVMARDENPQATTPTLAVDVLPGAEFTRLIVQLRRNGTTVASASSTVPTGSARDLEPYLADGLINELSLNWADMSIRGTPRPPPDAAAYALLRASLAKDASQLDRAIELAAESVDQDPGYASAYLQLSDLLRERGERGWAQYAYNTARALDPEVPTIAPGVDPVPVLQRALREVRWSADEPGLKYLHVRNDDYAVNLHAWQIDLKAFNVHVSFSDNASGRHAPWFSDRSGAPLVFNGGFLTEDRSGRQNPDGLLISEGAIHTNAWSGAKGRQGGILYFRRGSAHIRHSGHVVDPALVIAGIQSLPVLVDPDGAFAMQADDAKVARRTAVCIENPATIDVIIVDGRITAYQLARLLYRPSEVSSLQCKEAIALDGANSTQAVYRSRSGRHVNVAGERTLPYILVVTPIADTVGERP